MTGWEHQHVELVRVIDGDTIVVDVDHGFGVWSRGLHIRIQDFDAPESRSYSGHHATDAEKRHAEAARDEAVALFSDPFVLTTYKGNTFNRWLGSVSFVNGGVARDFAALMTTAGMAKRESYTDE